MKRILISLFLFVSFAMVAGLSAMECPGKEKRAEIHCPGDKK